MSAMEPAGEELWTSLAPAAEGKHYRMCRNYSQEKVCNWLIPAEEMNPFCRACRLNQIIPDLSQKENHDYWHRLELAKRRLIYDLLRLDLPLVGKQEDSDHGLAFAFLAGPEVDFREQKPVLIGHDKGLITINIAEANAAVREKMRLDMNERYRTLLGHFRHESGHYYWFRLIYQSEWLEPFRQLFGDEQENYGVALQRYYSGSVATDSDQRFISTYAGAHPWEDWAETWAHYLHMEDTLETAEAWGLTFNPRSISIEAMRDKWVQLTCAINNINRSMGMQDAYPFVITPLALEKLRFVQNVIRQAETKAAV